MNETHDPALRSWVDSANRAGHDFPIQNLPFGVFHRAGSDERFRGGVAIGDAIVDLGRAWHLGIFSAEVQDAIETCCAPGLNDFMALGARAWSSVRLALSRALRAGAREEEPLRRCLVPQSDAEMVVPARVGDYTDFYASVYHATNVGRQFRPDNPLLPNYAWIPIAYHGRASTIGVSGQQFPRPVGQSKATGAEMPLLQPTRRLDYELEVAVWLGVGNNAGERIPLGRAEEHIFGLGLLNDWSARDIQAWEYQPLGPFLGKDFATTVSPWIVTLEALEPFRAPWEGVDEGAHPLPYLDDATVRERGAIDVRLEALLQTQQMRRDGTEPARLCRTSFRHAYWTVAQMVAHHTVNGCALRPGDVFGTGTQSGPAQDQLGSLLELCDGGKRPVALPAGESRTFLEDGDSVILRAWCEKAGAARIGFGQCAGTVLPAIS